MNRLQSINWYDGLNESIFFFLVLFIAAWLSLDTVIVSSLDTTIVIQEIVSPEVSYFWWNYFLNNFHLLIGLLRLVCFLMVGR